MSLQTPEKKMSKSDTNANGFVSMLDTPDVIMKKFKRAVTDSEMKVRYAEKKQHEEALRQAEAVADGEAVDWQEVQRQWDEYYAQHPE